MRWDEAGHQFGGPACAGQSLFKIALIDERSCEIVMRHSASGIQSDRAPITRSSLAQTTEIAEHVAVVEMRVWQIRQRGERRLDQLQRRSQLAALVCEHAEQVLRVRVLRIC